MIRLAKREGSRKRGNKVAVNKNRLLSTGKRKPRLATKPDNVFKWSKLVDCCIKCGGSFEVFERMVTKSKKHMRRHNVCVACWRLIYKKNAAYRKNKWSHFKRLYIQRKTGGCEFCDYADLTYLSVYVFHHKDPKEKAGNISSITSAGYNLSNKKLFVREARKCNVSCRNCHAVEHEKEGVL